VDLDLKCNNTARIVLNCASRRVRLISHFGIFITYGLTNVLCIVAYQGHDDFHGVEHMLIPLFGVTAILACMAFTSGQRSFYESGQLVVGGSSPRIHSQMSVLHNRG
jgi:hypothetical protein